MWKFDFSYDLSYFIFSCVLGCELSSPKTKSTMCNESIPPKLSNYVAGVTLINKSLCASLKIVAIHKSASAVLGEIFVFLLVTNFFLGHTNFFLRHTNFFLRHTKYACRLQKKSCTDFHHTKYVWCLSFGTRNSTSDIIYVNSTRICPAFCVKVILVRQRPKFFY